MEKRILKIDRDEAVKAIVSALTDNDNCYPVITKSGSIEWVECSCIGHVTELLPEEYRSPLISSEFEIEKDGTEMDSQENWQNYLNEKWEVYCDYIVNDLPGDIRTWLLDSIIVNDVEYEIEYY